MFTIITPHNKAFSSILMQICYMTFQPGWLLCLLRLLDSFLLASVNTTPRRTHSEPRSAADLCGHSKDGSGDISSTHYDAHWRSTNVLVLLLYYAQGDVMNLYFRSDKPKADGTIEVYHINRIQEVLGHEMCSQLMFIHAMTGSDTKSRVFGVGKKTAFQKLAKGDHLIRSCAIAFTIPNQTTEVIDNLGCQVMAVLYGGNGTDSFATMRYNTFSKKFVSASSFVTPERLPQTESATKLHCRRAYYQVIVWAGKDEGMDPRNWGVDPAGQSARPTYVNDECCARQSVENHTLQRLHCLQNTSLLL